MFFTELTPATLWPALKAISTSRSEQECSDALLSAVTLLQNAVLNNQDPDSFNAALKSVPPEMAHCLMEVLGCAVDCHQESNGATLGLWLLPVSISIDKGFETPVSLLSGMPALRASGQLLEQLGLTPTQLGTAAGGWVYPIPALYTPDQLNSSEMSVLVQLPHATRRVVRGDAKGVALPLGKDSCLPGSNVLYMPFIAYSPRGQEHVRQLSEKFVSAMTKWVTASMTGNGLTGSVTVGVPAVPRPFSESLQDTPMQAFRAKLRYFLDLAVRNSGVSPKGMVAHLTLSAIPQTGVQHLLCIRLKAHLTRQPLGSIEMPTFTIESLDEMTEAKQLLRELGVARVQTSRAPIDSLPGSHRGGLQVLVPPDALVEHAMVDPPPSLH